MTVPSPVTSAARAAAEYYAGRGWVTLPIAFKEKGVTLYAWTMRGLAEARAALATDFPEHVPMNVGVLLGDASGGLVDVDLDCPESLYFAPLFLPVPAPVFGRSSKLASHYLYTCDVKTQKFKDPVGGGMLLELRSNGAQTVFPGSVHATGEAITWDATAVADPPPVDPEALKLACKRIAACSLLARYWPDHGRHDAQLALAGALLLAGWPEGLVVEVLCRVSELHHGDEERAKRETTVATTAEIVRNGRMVRHWGGVKDAINIKDPSGKAFKLIAGMLGGLSASAAAPVSSTTWTPALPGAAPVPPASPQGERFRQALGKLARSRTDHARHLAAAGRIARTLMTAQAMPEVDVRAALSAAALDCGWGLDEPERVASAIESALADPGDLRSRILRNENTGDPDPCLGNIVAIVSAAPEWNSVLGWNERTGMPEIVAPPPWLAGTEGYDQRLPREITTADGARLATWLLGYRVKASKMSSLDALGSVAAQNPFDRVRDYLEALPKWDGVPRCRYWLRQFAGAEDSSYLQSVSKRWLISAVARTLEPGCKVDTMLVLEGPQGIRKSTLLRVLFGDEFFDDHMPPITDKDAKQHVHGPWGIEIAELKAFKGREHEAIKAFLSLQHDRYRKPYGAGVTTELRRCVFAGTTNDDCYLSDSTGNRRIWPVACRGAIDIDGLRAVRDQIWAEALYRYEQGEQWWLADDEIAGAEDAQEQRYEADALEDRIRVALDTGVSVGFAPGGLNSAPGIPAMAQSVTVSEILQHVCRDETEAKATLQQRIGHALSRLKWSRKRDPVGDRLWRYWRPGAVPPWARGA